MSGRALDEPAQTDGRGAILLVGLGDQHEVAVAADAGTGEHGHRHGPRRELVLHVRRPAAPDVAGVVDVAGERRMRPRPPDPLPARRRCGRGARATGRCRDRGSGRPDWRARGCGRSARTRRRAFRGSAPATLRPASPRPAGCSCRSAAGREAARSPRRGARVRTAGAFRRRMSSPPRACGPASSAGRMVDTPAMNGRVTRVSIAPVKSLGLTHLESVELGRSGVVGDRRFWMVNDQGRLVNGKMCSALMQVHSAWDETTRRLVLSLSRWARARRHGRAR